jgi:crossover junction endodeoxyribonuclease RusA
MSVADGPAATSKAGVEGSHSPSAPSPIVRFTVLGIPAGKGSKRAFPHRTTGRIMVVDDNPPKLREWERAVRYALEEAVIGVERFDGPVGAHVAFYMQKPKSAPKTRRVWPTKKPDIDKLARAILDPMTGILFRDDGQVIDLHVTKHYAEDEGMRPGAAVLVWQIAHPHGEGE